MKTDIEVVAERMGWECPDSLREFQIDANDQIMAHGDDLTPAGAVAIFDLSDADLCAAASDWHSTGDDFCTAVLKAAAELWRET